MKNTKSIDWALRLANNWGHKHNFPSQQSLVFKKLLNKAKHTAFGQYYHFNDILEAEDPITAFQKLVPIHDYDEIFSKWWHRTLNGESNICWPGHIKYFALSSGTSNASSKRIPISTDMFSVLRRNSFGLFATLPAFNIPSAAYTKSWLGIGGSSTLKQVGDHFEGYLSGINVKKRPFWTRNFYKPENAIASIPDFEQRIEKIAQKAPEWDIGVLIGIPHWVQFSLERIIERHQLKSIKEIWPNLRLFVSGGTDYHPYQKEINRLVGHPIVYLNTYMASEGFIGHQTDSSSFDLQMLLGAGIFFEFVPFQDQYLQDEKDFLRAKEVFTINQVEANQDYAMLISTCSGAWRYLIGDVIRFTDPIRGRFKITGRTKYYLNLCSEHLTGDNTNEAVKRTEQDLKISISEYLIAPIQKENYLGHHWYLGTSDQVNTELLKSTLDHHLRQLNDDYHTERNARLRLNVKKLSPNTFYEWQKSRNQNNGQSKVPHVVKGTILQSWLSFIKIKENQAAS